MNPEDIYAALLEPAGMAEPYPLYAALRAYGPVIAAGEELVLIPGYDTVNSVLRDPEFRVDDAEVLERGFPGWQDHPALSARNLLGTNGADHRRVRAMLAPYFTHRRVQEFGPAIATITDQLLDSLAEHAAGGHPVDFMREFAYALPVTVICELMGVPSAQRDTFRPLARSLTAILEPEIDEATLAEGDAAAVTLNDLFTELVADRLARPRDDLISELAALAGSGDVQLSHEELIGNLALLLIAGFECSTSMLGNGLSIVFADRGLGDGLRSGSVDPAGFVEEVLRYEAPVQETGRRRRSPGEISGVHVTSDDEIILLLGAANRDPRRFAEPDAFRPERTDGGSLSFGAGLHFCLGAALARSEGTIAFLRLLRRFPELGPAGEPERRPGIVRTFDRMPVSL